MPLSEIEQHLAFNDKYVKMKQELNEKEKMKQEASRKRR